MSAGQFCPNCGHSVRPGAAFCGKCGQSLQAPADGPPPAGGPGGQPGPVDRTMLFPTNPESQARPVDKTALYPVGYGAGDGGRSQTPAGPADAGRTQSYRATDAAPAGPV
ncbi:MAG: zinc ribbon domain-containing protein, partial [Chloroflexi bacterium]|nr:zinc ribbon domain-containing protein [Chloroflexota bacterium]